MDFIVVILMLSYYGLLVWAVNNKKVMKVLAWLYVVSIVFGVIIAVNSYNHNGIESLALIIPCAICFWRAKRPESNNKWLEFFGLLCANLTSGGIMTHDKDKFLTFLTFIFAVLTTMFYILCERKINGKSIFPQFQGNQYNYQQPIIANTNETSEPKAITKIPKFIDEHIGETLYDKLKRLCNPANFIENYDKEKVEKANQIYRILEELRPISDEKCIMLMEKAEKELGITFLGESQFNNLKDKLNPKNFMQPYDAEKVSLSNELYSQLMQPDLNYTKFLQIKKKAESLLEYLRIEQGKKNWENFKQQRDNPSGDYNYSSNYYEY